MAVNRNYSNTAVATTLTAGINNSAVTLTVASATGYPVVPFTIVVDVGTTTEELMTVTAVSGTTFTVTRGVDGTTGATHALGASVKHAFSARDIREAQEHLDPATVATHGATGAIVGTTNVQTLTNKTLNSATFGEPIGHRNAIRNGDMGVFQRGAAAITASGVYTSDGWVKSSVGGTHTVSNQLAPSSADTGLNGAHRLLRSVTASQAAAADYALLHQRIESVRTFAGKQVTLSFLAYLVQGAAGSIGVEVEQGFGTGSTPSATVRTSISAIALSTVATRYTVTFTVPSIAGKILGTDENHYLQVGLWVSAGADSAARASSIGIQNVGIDITDIQLEQGSGSGFERLPQAQQLAWCQRYFVQYTHVPQFQRLAMGQCTSATAAACFMPFPQTMRAVPAATLSAQAHWGVIQAGGASVACTTMTAGATTAEGVVWSLGGLSGLVAGDATQLQNPVANATAALSAEL